MTTRKIGRFCKTNMYFGLCSIYICRIEINNNHSHLKYNFQRFFSLSKIFSNLFITFVANSVPQVEVDSFDVRASCLQVGDTPLGNIVTAIKIDVLKLVEPGSDVLN